MNPEHNLPPGLFQKMVTKKELARALGMSTSTLYRRLKDVGLEVPRGLISPEQQYNICYCLGFGKT
jgi:AraC-like DNA-binding protein